MKQSSILEKNMNKFGKIIFFVSSNSPAFFIWFIFLWDYSHVEKFYFSLFVLFLIILSYILLYYLLVSAQKRQSKNIFDIEICKNVNSQMMEYMVSYILPFISLGQISTRSIMASIIYYIVLYSIYEKSNLMYINPILNLFGFSIYEISYIESSIKKSAFLLSKKELIGKIGNKNIFVINNNIYLYKGDNL